MTWNAADPPELRRPRPWEYLRAGIRALVLLFCTYFGIVFVIAFNALGRRWSRAVAHWITCLWGTICLRLCGLRINRIGTPMTQGGAVVTNHSGWIDIFTMLAADRVYFISKSEVQSWPVIGPLSRQIGTHYINRRAIEAKQQEQDVRARLLAGDRLCFFPEGTSTDSRRVLRFRTSLFEALITPGLAADLWVQPVTLVYSPPPDQPPEFFGWWATMPLRPHLAAVFAMSAGAVVDVVHHPPLRAADFATRKDLAAACEAAVRQGMIDRLGGPAQA
ncbi:MAG: lysophospholipid acyltransferase family protein [Pseudomonadota bacterium]